MNQNVILTRDESGWIVAECPDLPGCVSQAGCPIHRVFCDGWETMNLNLPLCVRARLQSCRKGRYRKPGFST
jgi:hypothetical protein